MFRRADSGASDPNRTPIVQSPKPGRSPFNFEYSSTPTPTQEWITMQDIHHIPNADGKPGQGEKEWDGNRKLFVQLLDDMDNIGGTGMSARRRRRARELFSDWLFSHDVKSPDVSKNSNVKAESSARRFSGDFTDFDIQLPRTERSPGEDDVGDLQRQQPSRRSCGVINDVQRRGLYSKWRPMSCHIPTEDEADSGYHSGNSSMLALACKKPAPGERTLARDELKRRIESFNDNNTHGLLMEMPCDRNTFRGCIRVHMNLVRPINMRISVPSYDTAAKDPSADSEENLISFTLPKNSSKVIHISSTSNTLEVITVLLSKFSITDSPRKFSLYERCERANGKATMRRMSEDERPLAMCLAWADEGLENLDFYKFVLQENDSGEIMWEAFTLPELESFLNVLDREERECINQVQMKYRLSKIQLQKSLKEATDQKRQRNEKRKPVFV